MDKLFRINNLSGKTRGFTDKLKVDTIFCLFSDVHGEGILKAVLGVGFRRGF